MRRENHRLGQIQFLTGAERVYLLRTSFTLAGEGRSSHPSLVRLSEGEREIEWKPNAKEKR